MKKSEKLHIQQLSTLVGQFIRYWGFRNIHGQIWTLVYLSKQTLSGSEIAEFLEVSKALVSPALKELEDQGLIQQVESENSKTKRYQAVEDVAEVIRKVLKTREQMMVQKIEQSFADLESKCELDGGVDKVRLQNIGNMIQMAKLGLTTLLDIDQSW